MASSRTATTEPSAANAASRRATNRFVVSRRRTGLGDCLVSLSSAWHYAKRTGRTLVIDWRYSRYARDGKTNAFALLFEPVSRIAGVPVICDDSVNGLRLPGPVHGGLGRGAALKYLAFQLVYKSGLLRSGLLHERYERALYQSQRAEMKTLESESDRAEPTVLFERCLPEESPIERDDETFLADIRPREDIQDEIDRFRQAHFAGKRVIGLNLRHGNGGYIGDHAKYWVNESETVRRICRAVASLGAASDECAVFVCTDSLEVLNAIRQATPRVVARDKYFRPLGAGELHSFDAINESADRDLGKDAVVEMFLLADAETLICYPPDSYFSCYARRKGRGAKLTLPIGHASQDELIPIANHLC